MRSNIDMDTIFSIFFLLFISQVMVEALRDVKVRMPHAVRKGEKALLKCMYDMEGDSLYAVKWYKKGREFYRYTPKENPAMKVFGMHGFRIDRQASNESQLVLDHVSLSASGKYSCEVSADAPSFHTLIGAGELDVVETPSHKPIITNIRPKYRIGESVRGNCSSRNSKPAANLTWLINDQEVKPGYVKYHKPIKDKNDLETSYAYIQFVVTEDHFQRGKLKIRCRAHIHDIYSQSTEKSIEIERHKHNSVSSGSNTINVVHGYPYDQYSLHDIDNYDKKDTFMTHIQGDVSSLNSGGSSLYSITKLNGGLYHIILVGLLLQLTLLVILILPTYYIEQQQQQQQYKPQKHLKQYKEEGKQEEQLKLKKNDEYKNKKYYNCNHQHHYQYHYHEEEEEEEEQQQQLKQYQNKRHPYHNNNYNNNDDNHHQYQYDQNLYEKEVQITRRKLMNSFYSS